MSQAREWMWGAAAKQRSRRAVIGGAGAGLAGIGLASIACNARPKATSQPVAAQPKRGGTLTYAGGAAGSYDTSGSGFDPTLQSQSRAKGYTLFYERLVAYNQTTYAVEPELGMKWEQPSPTEYVFTLQPGVKFHNKPPANGRPMTSEDVVWSLERARIDDPKVSSRSLLTQIDQIQAPDANTVRITTKGPYASALICLSSDNLAILAREVIEKYPKSTTAESAVGTGPFVMNSVEQSVGAEYSRNPDYWKPGRPYLDTFRTKDIPDYNSAWAAFLAGQVDVALVPGSEVKAYLDKQGAANRRPWVPDDSMAFQFPNTAKKPFDDPRVSRALRLLIDHDEMLSSWAVVSYGRGGLGSVFPPALSAWDLKEDEYRQYLEWKQPKDDAAKEANALLAAAGITPQNPLKFTLDANNFQEPTRCAQLIQAQWKKWSQGAVDIDLRLSDAATVNSVRATRQFTYGYFGQSAGMTDPDLWLSSMYRSDGSLNYMGYKDPQADALIDKQRGIFDDAQRKAAVREVIIYLIDHSPATLPGNRFFQGAVQAKVQNQTPEYFLNGRQYQSVWLAG
jgi:ABC-type transport system substrate-binding protein